MPNPPAVTIPGEVSKERLTFAGKEVKLYVSELNLGAANFAWELNRISRLRNSLANRHLVECRLKKQQ